MVRLAAVVACAAAAMFVERDARACGACYAQSSESTIVTDHQMALSISKARTILWDRITYQGNPSEFAYVIPARQGTKLEASNDAWFSALDASTRPIVMAPPSGYGGGSFGEGSGCSMGCGASSASSSAEGSAQPKGESVQVVSEEVVGPYEVVTLRSTDADALGVWLRAHGFAIPASSEPIIAEYVKDGLDFIAMRLRPATSVRSMQPIRIVTPGGDPTLPLRMMSIGAGANLGLTLYVIGEGYYQAAAPFTNVKIEEDALVWDYAQNRSNYQSLSQAWMRGGDGRNWLTEYAKKPALARGSTQVGSGMLGNPGLGDAYAQACVPSFAQPSPPPDASAGTDAASDAASDAATADGGDGGIDDAGVTSDAAIADAGLPDASKNGSDAGGSAPQQCDDLDVAVAGMQLTDVRITRLRAFLPTSALDAPLRLEAAPKQEPYENVHYAKTYGTVTAGLSAGSAGTRGTVVTILAAVALLGSLLKRRRESRG